MANNVNKNDLRQHFLSNQKNTVNDQITEKHKNQNLQAEQIREMVHVDSNDIFETEYCLPINFENQDTTLLKSSHNSGDAEMLRFAANINTLTGVMKNMLNDEPDANMIEREYGKAERSYLTHSLRRGLIEENSDNLEIVRGPSNDPLHSVKSFEELHLKQELLNGISSMGFRKPSGIQERALPMLLDKKPRNLIAQSQSGTGKTATFLLTMLSKVDLQFDYCQCLCLAPTRELVMQIADVALTMSKFMSKVKIIAAVKGNSPDMKNGEVNAHIVIGTPGTLKHWTVENSCFYLNPKKLKVFVLDEADVFIEDNEFLNIAKRIKSKVLLECQILLFSATYEDRVMKFAHEFVPNYTEFNIKPQELTLKNIKQYYIKLQSAEDKYPTLVDIYGKKSMGQCIIFCDTRRMAQYLQKALEKDSHLSSLLTGELDVLTRQKEINDFRNGKSRVLIATNLCSRGIDIPQVNLIINWDMPKTKDGHPDCETYLHRIGRSGRFGKAGLTINFIVTDSDLEIQEKILQLYGGKIEEMTDLEIVAQM